MAGSRRRKQNDAKLSGPADAAFSRKLSRGYGRRQLALALDICRGMGIGIARLSCDVDKVASRRVIEANGGVLLRQCAPSWFAEAAYLLYEIPLI